MTGSQGGIKPGNGVGGRGPPRGRRAFARRRWKDEGGRDGASQRVGGPGWKAELPGGLESNSPSWRARPALSDALSCTEERMGPLLVPFVGVGLHLPAAADEPHLLAPHLRVQLPSTTFPRGSSTGRSEEQCGEKSFLSIPFHPLGAGYVLAGQLSRREQGHCRKEWGGVARPCGPGLG